MKRITLQLSSWWPRSQRTGILLPQLDLMLQASGFTLSQNPAQDRKSDESLYGWSRVAFGKEKAWFALCSSRDGPWTNLKVRSRRRATVVVFEDLFRVIVEQLQPQECSLVASNADDLPIFAQEWCKGGIGVCVNCDSEPMIEFRPGDPGWFREKGVERRYVSQRLLSRQSVDPVTFASRTGRIYTRTRTGFTFDGGWAATWSGADRSG
jgi:hypothetical protein